MFNLKRYFVKNKLYKYIVRIKFVYYRQKHLIALFYNAVININFCFDINTVYWMKKKSAQNLVQGPGVQKYLLGYQVIHQETV